MHQQVLSFIQDLAIIMLVAGFVTFLCRKFKQPVVLGYILAGIIIGPHTPPFSFIYNKTIVNVLAEIGVIFLLFFLGLEFDLHKLSKVGKTAIITALLEILLMVWLGYELGILFGWTSINALFLGALISISSTTIIVKALDELRLKHEKFAQIIFGVLIVEDIFAILILALLSSIAISGTLNMKDIFMTSTKFASFLVVSLVFGILLIPRLLSYIAKFKSNEMLLISVLGLAFGFCLLVAKLDYSMALGAFIIGSIMAESDFIRKIQRLIAPLRDMFSAIFFVSVGLRFEPRILVDYFFPIVFITLLVVIGKIVSCTFGVLITGYNGRTALRTGMGLAQIGEFSFIIASLGLSLNVTGGYLYSIAVCVSIITTLLTPYLIQNSNLLANGLSFLIPEKISGTFSVYTDWMQNINLSHNKNGFKKMVNRSIAHIIINLFIISAIFLGAKQIAHFLFRAAFDQIPDHYLQKSLIWTAALVLSLPFIVAIYRKIQALSRALAELSIKKTAKGRIPRKIRQIISGVIPIFAVFLIMILIFILSSSILPSKELLVLILIVVGALLLLIFPWFIKIHSKLQISLMDSMRKRDEDK